MGEVIEPCETLHKLWISSLEKRQIHPKFYSLGEFIYPIYRQISLENSEGVGKTIWHQNQGGPEETTENKAFLVKLNQNFYHLLKV